MSIICQLQLLSIAKDLLLHRTSTLVLFGTTMDTDVVFLLILLGSLNAVFIITNLSDSSRALVEKVNAPLIVQAGYAGDNTTLFTGRVRTCDHVRKGSDWETIIKSGDGEQELKLMVNLSILVILKLK